MSVRFVPLNKVTEKDMIVELAFESCDEQRLKCRMVQILNHGSEAHPKDSVWKIEDPNIPTRYVRLFNGRTSIHEMTKHYGFMDSNQCINKNKIMYGIHSQLQKEEIPIETDCIRVKGIAQEKVNSGICWFAATSFATLFSEPLRTELLNRIDSDIAVCGRDALTDTKQAKEYRKKLYYRYGFGDDPKQDPLLDGKNGCTEFCALAAQLDLPVIRIFAPEMNEMTSDVKDQFGNIHELRSDPKPDEFAILIVRCFRTQWIPRRRLKYKGRRYKLFSVFIGSEHCGHQIGASTCNGRVCRWAVADSDGSRLGIGPVFWRMKRFPGESRQQFKQRWWDSFASMIPLTIFNRGDVCDLSPHNRPSGYVLQKNTSDKPGVTNSDFLYISVP